MLRDGVDGALLDYTNKKYNLDFNSIDINHYSDVLDQHLLNFLLNNEIHSKPIHNDRIKSILSSAVIQFMIHTD